MAFPGEADRTVGSTSGRPCPMKEKTEAESNSFKSREDIFFFKVIEGIGSQFLLTMDPGDQGAP